MAGTEPPAQAGRFHHRQEQIRPAPEVPLLDAQGGTDYRYLYDLIVACAQREEDRAKALDTKITSLIAGVVAFIGFSFRVQSTVWNAASAFVYLFPLIFLFSAFIPKRVDSGPRPDALARYFPRYPDATLRDAVRGLVQLCIANERINDRKAARLDIAVLLTAAATAIALIEQIVLDVIHP